jgi:signal peptidase I
VNALRTARENTVVETVVFLIIAVAVVLLGQMFLVKPYRIPSASMEPTLNTGDRVLVNRFSTRVLDKDVKVGDVVVFHPPAGAGRGVCGAEGQGGGTDTPCSRPTPERSKETFIKRVVAVGGDRVGLRDGHVVRNGTPAREPFAADCGDGDDCDFGETITIPEGYVYLLGDNRGNSEDSRFWGPIPEDWVIGGAFAFYWPPGRIDEKPS